jgi:hypothetical protein
MSNYRYWVHRTIETKSLTLSEPSGLLEEACFRLIGKSLFKWA